MSETPFASPAELAANGIAAQRGGRIVVEGVDLNIAPGGIFLLRGPNGAGKTTLLRTLAGFAPVASGTLSRTAASTVFLGHADGVKNAMTARENLEFWKSLYQASASELEAAAAALRIGGFMDQRASAMSAGQRRRLALCRVVISRRPIWLLDEPTSGMDAQSVASVVDLIERHAQRGGAAVVATHEPLNFSSATTLTLSEAA